MTSVITAEEIEQTIQQKNLSNWFNGSCSICDCEYGYLFKDGRVFFTSSCHCAISYPRESSHQAIADHINMQTNKDVIDGLLSFWKPEDRMSDLDSMKFVEDDDRAMYVNDLDDGGIGFVIWNGQHKNIFRITEDGKEELINFLTREQN